MKKLLYTLLAVSLIFSACEEEDSLAPNNNNNNASSIIGYGWGNDILYKTTDGGATWNFVNNLPAFGWNNEHTLKFTSENIGIFVGLRYIVSNGNWFPYYSMSCKTTVSGGLGFTDEYFCWNRSATAGVAVLDNINGMVFFEASENSLWFSLGDAKLRKYQIPNNGSLSIPQNLYTYEGVIFNNMDIKAISFVDDNIGFALSNDGSFSKTTNGGSSWNNVGGIPETDNFSCLAFPSSNVGYATANSWLYKTTDGGNTWTQFTQINIQDIEFVTDNIGYGFFSGMLYQTTDGGDNWSMINDNSIGLSEISFIN
jgi:hypothetical protein